MSISDVLEEKSSEQGWDESSQLALLLEYVENQGDECGFREFLRMAIEDMGN